MTSRHVLAGSAIIALALSVAPARAQGTLPGNQGPWDGATVVYRQKQVFVGAVRDLSISLIGRFGDEGRRLRSDVDALEAALRAWDQSILEFRTALKAGRMDADAQAALGTVYLDRYRLQDALRGFDAAAKLAPRRADVHQFAAMVHGLAGRPAEALRELRRAQTIQPEDAVTRYEIARYTIELGEGSPPPDVFTSFHQAALKQLRATLHTEAPFTRPGLLRQTAGVAPLFPPAPYVQAFESLMNGRFEEGIAACRKALETDPLLEPSNGAGALMEGSTALRKGDLPSALRYLTEAVASDPDRSEAHRILGVASRLDEQLEQSVAAFSAAVRLQPQNERARLGLADVLMDMERFDEAEKVLQETARALPQGVQAQYRLGRLYQSRGQYDEALKNLEYAAQFTPLAGRDPLFEMLALIYASQADFDHATEALRKQTGVNPNNADAHRRLGDTYVRQGRTNEALTEFLAALLVDPANVLSHVGIAQLQLRTGNHVEAMRAAREALALDPAQKEARYVLATSLTRTGQAEDAKREFAEFERLQVQAADEAKRKFETDGLRRQIAVSLGAGEHQAAIPLLRQLISLEPGEPAHYITLGQSLLKTGQNMDAATAFETALERRTGDPNVYRYLAEVYLALGDAASSRLATTRYREAIEIAKRRRAERFAAQ
jgi:tetratricopeptide (TPR) repeat protein